MKQIIGFAMLWGLFGSSFTFADLVCNYDGNIYLTANVKSSTEIVITRMDGFVDPGQTLDVRGVGNGGSFNSFSAQVGDAKFEIDLPANLLSLRGETFSTRGFAGGEEAGGDFDLICELN